MIELGYSVGKDGGGSRSRGRIKIFLAPVIDLMKNVIGITKGNECNSAGLYEHLLSVFVRWDWWQVPCAFLAW